MASSYDQATNLDVLILPPIWTVQQEFYQAVALLSVLAPVEHARRSYADLGMASENSSTSWHKFLDSLSWLCDYQLGGKTVVSIAVESAEVGPIYWIAMNHKVKQQAVKHLKLVLNELRTAGDLASAELDALQYRISEKSVSHCWKKVENYRRQLSKLVQAARGMITNASAQDTRLLAEFTALENLKHDRPKLCSLAYDFRHNQSDRYLCEKIKSEDSSRIWSQIRHFIGRLGSWIKASKILVDVAKNKPDLLRNSNVKEVPTPSPTELPIANLEGNFQDVLSRILPSYDSVRLEEILQSMDSPTVSDIATAFANRHGDRGVEPYVHAELILLEYFHSNKLKFARNDRYIGCSKRSCYCCDLYMRFHPSNPVIRPCHGNVWVKWCPPGSSGGNTTANRPSNTILEQMISRISEDILSHILAGRTRSICLRDSTTGMSLSIPHQVTRP